MYYDVKKGPYKIQEEFFKNSPNHFWKKWRSPMQWTRIGLNFRFKFPPGEILNKVAMFKYFSTFEYLKKKSRSPMENSRIELLISGGSSEQNYNVQILFYIIPNCIFSKTIWRKKFHSPIEKGRIEFSISFLELGGGEFWTKW